MADLTTLGDLFEMAIAVEHAAETLYYGLEEKFSDHPDVVAFWHVYALDEIGHANQLAKFRDALSPEELARPADPLMLDKARKLLESSVETRLAEVQDLEDAYQLVNELENGETNAIFEFMIVNFASDEAARKFLRSQLKDHIGRLMIDFPSQFTDVMVRRQIKARS